MIYTNDQIRFDEIKELKAGDIVFESANFIGTWVCKLLTDVEEFVGDDENRKIRWRCKTGRITSNLEIESPQEQDYLVTKGFEHYGPQIYKELVIRDADGNFSNFIPEMS